MHRPEQSGTGARAARTIDVHAHYVPCDALPAGAFERTGDSVVFTMGGPGNARVGPVPAAVMDPDAQRAALSGGRIDCRVLSLPPFALADNLSGDEALAYSRASNRALGRLSAESRGKFLGLATVPLSEPRLTPDVLREAVDTDGLRGVEICSYNGVRELDDAALEPFWAAAEATGLPVMIHPHRVAGAERMVPYYLQNLVGNPLETSLAAARLVFGNVLARHPGLTVILSHGGGAFPFIAGRLQRGADVRPECRGTLSPWEALRRVYVDTVVFDPAILRALLTLVPAQHVLLGSDVPFSMSERDAVSTVEASVAPGPDRDAILAGTAAHLLRG